MAQDIGESTPVVAPSSRIRNPIYIREDSALGQSLDSKTSPRKPATPVPPLRSATAPGPSLLTKLFKPTAVRRATITVMPPKHACDSDTRDTSSHSQDAAHHEVGPDSACSVASKPGTATPDSGLAFSYSPVNQQELPITPTKDAIPEQQTSRPLEKYNPVNQPEQVLAEAHPVRPEVQPVDAGPAHGEPSKYGVVHSHMNEFARIEHKEELTLAQDLDLGGFFRFPPSDLSKIHREVKDDSEFIDLDKVVITCQGLDFQDVHRLLNVHSEDVLSHAKYVEKANFQSANLQAKARSKTTAFNNLQANIAALTEHVARHPGTDTARASHKTLDSMTIMKSKVQEALKDIDQELRAKAACAVQCIEDGLLCDFDPAEANAIRWREQQAAKVREDREEWNREWSTPWRVKGDAQKATSFNKSAWRWHSEDDKQASAAKTMATFPNGPAHTYPTNRYADYRVPSPPQLPTDPEELKIPPWFALLDSKGSVHLSGGTPEARFKDLMTKLLNLGVNKRWKSGGTSSEKTAQREWHEPDPGWPHPEWQKLGGWWICRSGPTASRAEQMCAVCRPKRKARQVGPRQQQQGVTPARASRAGPSAPLAKISTPQRSRSELRDALVAEIEESMAECHLDERTTLRERLKLAAQAYEELDRMRAEEESQVEGDEEDPAITVYFVGSEGGEQRFKLT